jgi:hypothetical protein
MVGNLTRAVRVEKKFKKLLCPYQIVLSIEILGLKSNRCIYEICKSPYIVIWSDQGKCAICGCGSSLAAPATHTDLCLIHIGRSVNERTAATAQHKWRDIARHGKVAVWAGRHLRVCRKQVLRFVASGRKRRLRLTSKTVLARKWRPTSAPALGRQKSRPT